MCGIVGVIGLDAPPEGATLIVRRMAERIRHRGPDGGGTIAHPDATLGMTRLAIVDVAHGNQPMSNEDGSIVIVYNGEIYNAPEIRRSLERRGVRFRTRSDTEVILRLYERDPDAVEENLVGMWAFAIHDRRRRRVILSRDRFGIKPLFVADSGRALAFASELRCFDRAQVPFDACFELDHSAAHAMVSWSFVPETATMWRGVRRVPPASRITIDLSTGARATSIYWSLRPSKEASTIGDLKEACTHVETLLRRSVREHLESDVPIATFLSGGIDSSLIAAYAREASPQPLHAFTIGFREKRFDESPYARATAAKLGVPLDVLVLDEATARAKLADALLAYDEPFGDSSSLATYLLSQHVSKSYKVALGGDGGDEGFAGYKKYQILRVRRPFDKLPSVRNAIGLALGRLPTRTDRTRGWTEALRTLRRLARGLNGDAIDIQVELAQVAPLAKTAALMRQPSGAESFVEAARARFAASEGSDLQRMLACEMGNALCNDMLVKVDRASMASSLEVRVPFLDHRVVEAGVGLRQRLTLSGGGKRVLRSLHERRFGRALATRKKQGFGVPVEVWLRGPLDRACEALFERRRLERYGVLASETLADGGFRTWVRNDPVLLWHAFALAAWCEATLGDGPDALRDILEHANPGSNADVAINNHAAAL